MTVASSILLACLLIALNAYFVAAEFGFMAARLSQIEIAASAGSRRAAIVLNGMRDLTLMLACSQAGVTATSLGLGMVTEPAFAHLFEPIFHSWVGGEASAHGLAVILALLVVVYAHVVFGEMVPKNLAIADPERTALLFGPPLVFLSRILAPLLKALNAVAGGVLRLFRVKPRTDVSSVFTADEVASMVELAQAEGTLESESSELLADAIDFSRTLAHAVMVSSGDLVTLPRSATPEQVEAEVARTGFSRFPLTDSAGTIVGYIHVKDMLSAPESARELPLDPARVRRIVSVEPDALVSQVLEDMQSSGAHLVKVHDAALGHDEGVVFLEDILEELVGEVVDSSQRGRR